MKFNWIFHRPADEKLKRLCVELEYQLRPKITRFLLNRFDDESVTDFSCFHFEVDTATQWVRLSEKTPLKYRNLIQMDFDKEINGSQRHLYFNDRRVKEAG